MELTRNDILNNKDVRVVVLGAGATGSYMVEQLVALGIQDILVYDDDAIESHNITNQIYSTSMVGSLKVVALKNIIKVRYDIDIDVSPTTLDTIPEGTDVIINCTDSYEGRYKKHDCPPDVLHILTGIGVYHWETVIASNSEALDEYINKRPTKEVFETPDGNEPTSPCGSRLTVLGTVFACVGQTTILLCKELNNRGGKIVPTCTTYASSTARAMVTKQLEGKKDEQPF